MKKIDIRDIRSEEILAVNRGENTLFSGGKIFQSIPPMPENACSMMP